MKKTYPEPWNYSYFDQFHAHKALFKAPINCNINFWIENDPPPLGNFSKNSSNLVEGPFLGESGQISVLNPDKTKGLLSFHIMADHVMDRNGVRGQKILIFSFVGIQPNILLWHDDHKLSMHILKPIIVASSPRQTQNL